MIAADLRGSRMHLGFGTDGSRGLTSLSGGIPAADVVSYVRRSRFRMPVSLRVIGSGPETAYPAAVLKDPAVSQMLRSVTTGGRVAVIAAPGVLDSADALALLGDVPNVVLVATRTTTKDDLGEARELLTTAGANIVGVVLVPSEIPTPIKRGTSATDIVQPRQPQHDVLPAQSKQGADRG